MRIYLNDNWSFKMDNQEREEIVRLPHSVVETPFNYFDEEIYQGISSYKKTIKKRDEFKGKHIILTIEAAAHKMIIKINEKEIASHSCGYTAKSLEIENYLDREENILEIIVDSRENLNLPPFGNAIDYMTYGGIYREVYLDIKSDNYICDVFLKTRKIEKDKAYFEIETKKREEKDEIEFSLFDKYNKEIKLDKNETGNKVEGIIPWSPNTPELYTLTTRLKRNKEVIDVREDRIGFRTTVFKTDGFYLNNEKFKIRGLDRHQSYPYIGYAMPKSMQEADADILKNELSLNAVRTAHYPQSHHFINRCDEIGLLVFTEIPGWQHIGNAEWKDIAVNSTREMIMQWRNHPSIFVWGVRINESADDDEFYKSTNELSHSLDDTRATSGVRFIEKSSLLEDVYSFNDFSHDGTTPGCKPKDKVTPDVNKAYMITEYNGHMFPTKSYDNEDKRVEHALRHARVVNAYYGEDDIAGGFGWCFADYNTHKDFGSGDRICYHGVMDMFRNEKLAASVYSSQETKNDILEISSSMDIGEHPAGILKDVYAITNAESVKLYKNGTFIKEFFQKDSQFKNLPHGLILIDDFVGDLIKNGENFSASKARDIKKILLAANKYGISNLPLRTKLLAAKCILFKGMKFSDGVELYNKYIGNWGGIATVYTFEAIKDNRVVKTVIKTPVKEIKLETRVSHTDLKEINTYDVASIRISLKDSNDNTLSFSSDVVKLSTQGEIEIIGPKLIPLMGGHAGTYVKTLGKNGQATLLIEHRGKTEKIDFTIEIKNGEKL